MKTIYIGKRSQYLGAKIDLREWLFGISFDVFSEEDENIEEPGFMLNIGIGPLIVILAIPFINKLRVRANTEALGEFLNSVQAEGLGTKSKHGRRFICGNPRTMQKSLKQACELLNSKAVAVKRVGEHLVFTVPGVLEFYDAVVTKGDDDFVVNFVPSVEMKEEENDHDQRNS